MENLSETLQVQATAILKEVVGDLAPEADVTQSTNPQFGHYQCNSAMKVAKELKTNPRKIAEEMIEKWKPDGVIDAAMMVPDWLGSNFYTNPDSV